MNGVLLALRLILAAIFATAGLAKLADRPGSRQAVIDFGVPEALASPLGLIIPLLELACAVALIPTHSAWAASAGALLLLVLFSAGIGANMARGRRPDCHCFGQIHSQPAGWPALARNLVFMVLAATIVLEGRTDVGLSVTEQFKHMSGLEQAALVAGVILVGILSAHAWFTFDLRRQVKLLTDRLEALEQASYPTDNTPPERIDAAGALPQSRRMAPAFALQNLAGETVTLDMLRTSQNPLLLVFASAGCGACTTALTDAVRWQNEHHSQLTVVPLVQGKVEEVRAKAEQLGLTNVLVQDAVVAREYDAQSTPSAVIVRADGTIGSDVVTGPIPIRALAADALGIAPPPQREFPAPAQPVHETTPPAVIGPADADLLVPLKQSQEYRVLHRQNGDLPLVDSWEENGLHFFVFQLSPLEEGSTEGEPLTAVFIMEPAGNEPMSAVIVRDDGGEEPDVIDLRQSEQLDTLQLVVA